MTRNEVVEALMLDPKALFLDGEGFDECVIGAVAQFGRPMVVAYDYEKLIGALGSRGLNREDAEEHFGFNIIGAWVGEFTPVFVRLLDTERSEASDG